MSRSGGLELLSSCNGDLDLLDAALLASSHLQRPGPQAVLLRASAQSDYTGYSLLSPLSDAVELLCQGRSLSRPRIALLLVLDDGQSCRPATTLDARC